MGDNIVIRARGLGKRYRIGRQDSSYRSLRESLASLASAPARKLAALARGDRPGQAPEAIWALKDVDLDVRQGEVLGIIGRNGAGKSTLLKILSRITEPTTGRVELTGRVGSLLEVGTGFHPELTGRENIYLNGAILGMRKSEIDCRFDEIVDFAEIDRFLDTPVKRYSSGMYVRLAFAVAAHLEPEILLVDEVLSVGDAAFQRKCLGKIGDVARGGRTVLFVSHQLAAVATLSKEVLVLENGSVTYKGETGRGVDRYLASMADSSHQTSEIASQDGSIVLKSFKVTDVQGCESETVANTAELQIRIRVKIVQKIPGLVVGFTLSLPTGEVVFSSFSTDLVDGDLRSATLPGQYGFRCTIPGKFLNERTYFLGPVLQVPGSRMLLDLPRLKHVEVVRTIRKAGSTVRPGCILPYLNWEVVASNSENDTAAESGVGCDDEEHTI